MEEKLSILKRWFEDVKKKEIAKPLKVAVMGQTGVGKSSLINALFGTVLKTDRIRPCTKEIEQVEFLLADQQLIFFDMPGIGESELADEQYLDAYIKYIHDCDVVIWAIHADSRSTTFDLFNLNKIIGALAQDEKERFLSKITFVLTKADLLTPPAWIYGLTSENGGIFTPTPGIAALIQEKERYYQEIFIESNAQYLTSTTYNDCAFTLNESGFESNEFSVTYRGFMSRDLVKTLSAKYPRYEPVFLRLYHNFEVITCSSQFRYNLNKLLLVVVNKMALSSIGRVTKFINETPMDFVNKRTAYSLGNMIVYDMLKKETKYNLAAMA